MKQACRIVILVIILITWALIANAQATYVHAKHMTYDIVYDYSHMSPAAVCWSLKASDFSGSITTKPKYFKQDRLLPKPRLKNDLFSFMNYQRGHLCPSGDRDSRKDWFRDTFYTSNIVPMTAVCNAGAWKETETICRTLATQGHELRIVAGPLWCPDGLPYSTQLLPLIPDTLYKVATCIAHHDILLCWLIPNSTTPYKAVNCQHDHTDLLAILPKEISKLIQIWISK